MMNYVIGNDWNVVIPQLGSNLGKRVLMLSHILPGILCMIIYPLQRLLDQTNHTRHYLIGTFLIFFSFLASIFGNLYIFLYGTIGGLFMSISFSVGGFLLMISAIGVVVSGYLYRKKNIHISEMSYIDLSDIDFDPQSRTQMKNIHLFLVNMFGAMVYSSLFYRQLYFNAYIFGYPSSHPPTVADYERPLDRTFQIIYYVLPIFFMLLYSLVNKSIRTILKVVLLIYSVYILIVTLVLIFR